MLEHSYHPPVRFHNHLMNPPSPIHTLTQTPMNLFTRLGLLFLSLLLLLILIFFYVTYCSYSLPCYLYLCVNPIPGHLNVFIGVDMGIRMVMYACGEEYGTYTDVLFSYSTHFLFWRGSLSGSSPDLSRFSSDG